MRDRRGRVDGLRAAQRHGPIAVVARFPIERRAPAFRLHRRPASREPDKGRAIAAVGHELHPFGVADQSVRKLERLDERAMPRALAIEGEALAIVSHLNAAAVEFVIGRRRVVGLADRDGAWILVSRMQRVLREQMQDVGQQQFLMLLFMIAAELDQRCDCGRKIVLHKRRHRTVDMVAIRGDRLERRAGDHAASRTRLTRANALVIGIEQEIELAIERAITGQSLFENHSLEKPCRMREMPFRRACVGHRLHGRVGVGQRRAEPCARRANRLIKRAEIGIFLRRTMRLRDTHAILVL